MSDLTIALYGQDREDYINQRRLNRKKKLENKTYGIVDTLTRFRFIDEFKKIRPDNFSYEGLHALFDYFEELSYDIGQPIEFDPIAICCDYTEYESFKQLQEDYNSIESMEELHNHTTVINLEDSDGFIIQQF